MCVYCDKEEKSETTKYLEYLITIPSCCLTEVQGDEMDTVTSDTGLKYWLMGWGIQDRVKERVQFIVLPHLDGYYHCAKCGGSDDAMVRCGTAFMCRDCYAETDKSL